PLTAASTLLARRAPRRALGPFPTRRSSDLYRWTMAAVIVATFGVSMLNLAGPWILREFLHHIQDQRVMDGGLLRLFEGDGPGSLARHLAVFTPLYASVYAVRGVCQFVTSYLAHVTAWNFVSDLRVALYHHLQKLSLRFYQDRKSVV